MLRHGDDVHAAVTVRAVFQPARGQDLLGMNLARRPRRFVGDRSGPTATRAGWAFTRFG
jgi:hypothetical protein